MKVDVPLDNCEKFWINRLATATSFSLQSPVMVKKHKMQVNPHHVEYDPK
jgi:hypothetical protein